MTRVLATYNIKGGVGKTSAAVNLAYLAAAGGARTLLWDLDPQGASTYVFRMKPRIKGGGRKLVRGKSDVDTLIKGADHERLDVLPADFSYRHMDLALADSKNPTSRLARVLEPLRDDYDYVFLDCPPSISLVSEGVFEAADVLLVPIVPATLSSRTFDQLRRVVANGDGDATAARLPFDGRRAQAPAPRAHRIASERVPRGAHDGDPVRQRRRADGFRARSRPGVRPAQPRRSRVPRVVG